MNEQTRQVNGGMPPMQDELLQALIGKVVDLGTAVHDSTLQLKKLADQQEVVGAMNERIVALEKQVEELIKKNGVIEEEVKKISERLDVPMDKIETLQQELVQHGRLFEKPIDKTVHYRHYLGWPIVVIGVLFVITCASVGFANSQWNRLDRYEANDIKWRFIQLSHDSTVLKAVDQTIQLYLEGSKGLTTDVEQEEERREQLLRNMLKEREAHKNIQELNAKEKRR